jgi:hypothetical protein
LVGKGVHVGVAVMRVRSSVGVERIRLGVSVG